MNEQMIHVTTTYDEQICGALVHLMLCRLRRWPRYVLLLVGLSTSVAAGMIMLTQGSVSALPFLIMVLGSMLCMAALRLVPIASRMLAASYGKTFPTFDYTFGEEIHIAYGEHEKAYSYGYVLRLIEMSGLLFLFMKDGQLFILRQADVKEGYGQLKALLEARMTGRK